MPNDYYPDDSTARRKAKSLFALEATTLLIYLPVVLSIMTKRQIQRVRKVLDAAVVNPAIKKEQQDLYRQSIARGAGTGGVVMPDPKIERRADKAGEGMIWAKEKDKHIRLDFEKLLVEGALNPITDNPDEAAYLKKVRATLEEEGVWLRVGQEIPSDPRSFVVWLSLGYGGDAIPTKTGSLDREALLGNQLLGANYYDEVHQGPVQKELKIQIGLLELEIEEGEREHRRLIQRYDDAFPGVAELSDAIGGAKLPGRSIWAASKKLMLKARGLNTDGNVMQAHIFLLAAAISVGRAAQALSTYAEKSSDGAASVVTVLEIAKTAGEIAEVALAVTGAASLARSVAGSSAATNAAKTAASNIAKNRAPAAYYKTHRPGPTAFGETVLDTNLTTGGSKIARDRALGWNRDVQAGLDSAYAANGRREVSMDQLETICKAADAKWGNPLHFLD